MDIDFITFQQVFHTLVHRDIKQLYLKTSTYVIAYEQEHPSNLCYHGKRPVSLDVWRSVSKNRTRLSKQDSDITLYKT